MPMFSQESFSKLSTCHLDLQALFFEAIKTFDCKILEGHRNEIDQNNAYDRGSSRLKWPFGKHNELPSMAVDVAPYPVEWKDVKRFYFFGGYVLGIAQRLKDEGKITHGIRWGGDWNQDKRVSDQTFNDLCHFELII